MICLSTERSALAMLLVVATILNDSNTTRRCILCRGFVIVRPESNADVQAGSFSKMNLVVAKFDAKVNRFVIAPANGETEKDFVSKQQPVVGLLDVVNNAGKVGAKSFHIEASLFRTKNETGTVGATQVPKTTRTLLPSDNKTAHLQMTTLQSYKGTPNLSRPLGETCSTSKDCYFLRNTRCVDGVCQCWEAFVWVPETKLCEKIVNIRESCNNSIQCNTKDAVCKDGICQCQQRYDRLRNKCISYDEALSNESYHLIVVCAGIALCLLLFAMSICVLKSRSCRLNRERGSEDWSERRRLLPRYDDLMDDGHCHQHFSTRYLLIDSNCPLCREMAMPPFEKPPPLYETAVTAEPPHVPIPEPINGSPPPPYSDLLDQCLSPESSGSLSLVSTLTSQEGDLDSLPSSSAQVT